MPHRRTEKKNIPQTIKTPTQDAKNALILYAVGKIKSSNLPSDVFVNYLTKGELLYYTKVRMKQAFKEILDKKGFYGKVPPKINLAFDNLMKKVYKSFENQTQKGVEKLSSESSDLESLKQEDKDGPETSNSKSSKRENVNQTELDKQVEEAIEAINGMEL